MALPSRPNTRVGLPSNPRSRSTPRRDIERDTPTRPGCAASTRPRTASSPSAPPRPLRSQRSMVDLSRDGASRGRPTDRTRPPVPPLPRPTAAGRFGASLPPSRNDSFDSLSTGTSRSSNDAPSYAGYASSMTSVEDEEAPLDSKTEGTVGASFGSSLWSRVAAAAGSLTVSVIKALEANVSFVSGEETPLGQESRLTRAMKAYHISKAGSPADLPDWLFDERERGLTNRLRGDDSPAKSPEGTPESALQSQPFRVKDVALAPTMNADMARSRPSTPQPELPLSRAAQRLKEMMEAKRNPRVKFLENAHPRYASPSVVSNPPAINAQPVSDTVISNKTVRPRPLPTVDLAGRKPRGLPSGVRPRRT